MASNQVDGLYTLTVPVVMAHPSLITARAFKRNGQEKGEPKFGASFIFDPESVDIKAMKAKAVAVAAAKWPGRQCAAESKVTFKDETVDGQVVKVKVNPTFKFPFTSGDVIADKRVEKLKKEGKEDDKKGDFQRGKVVVKTASKFAPRLAVIVNGKPTDLTEDTTKAHSSKFYFGVKVLAQFNFVPYDKVGEDGTDGVTVYLNSVLSLNTGEKLSSGGQSAAETFKGYVGQASEEDPTAGTGADNVEDI